MIRVLIVDKPRLFCHTMRAVVQKENDMCVVGCATTIEEALAQVSNCHVILVSTTLSNEDTLKMIQDICTNNPEVRVLVVGVGEVTDVILKYVEAGSAGYVLQEDSVEKLLQKIRAAYNGEALVSPRIAARLMARLAELANMHTTIGAYPSETMHRFAELTPREREVLHLMSQGYSNQGIADRLIIECGTVKNHVHNILKKLEASNRQEAVYMMKIRSNSNLMYAN